MPPPPPPPDSRLQHHMPVHQQSYPPPGPGYSQPSHPMHHHHSARHASNGPPPPMPVGGPPPPPLAVGGPPPPQAMPMPGPPPPEAGGPPPAPVTNGHRHGTPGPPGLSPATRAGKEKQDGVLSQLALANENTWMLIGAVSEQMNDQPRALQAFENALRHNPNSILGLNAVASLARNRDDFDKAIEYFQRILNIKQDNGDVWGSMGHCLLMKDDLPKAYTAYQQALHYLPNPKEPKLWYGIGILYDRYGSFEHAEEAFSSVLKMDPNFEKANEIYFRLGIIYKHQRKYSHSLECFRYIISNPPRPLTSWDIWFQLGHVYELDHDYSAARDAYMRVLGHQSDHAKVLQQLGWLYHQPGASFANQEQAVQYLTKSLETDGTDAQSWYLLGRAFMAGSRYNKAYEAYQQAVYRDGRNPTFWCSIGVLYFQINQYRDALDAYSRAIRLNPYIWEVWYNLGSLYESCNNQITDAIDAYSRAAELDASNNAIKHRLQLLQNAGSSNAPLPPAPAPVDVHPSQYATPPGGGYGNNASPTASPHLPQAQVPPQGDARDGQPKVRDLPAPPGEYGRGSPGPFRGGGPPPLNHVDESRGSMALHAPLGPIDTDRPEPRDLRERYEGAGPGPYGERGHGEPVFAHQERPGEPPHFDRRHEGGRYDPTSDSRRQAPSPGSPRHRGEPGPPHGYPPHAGGPPHPGYRDREREEWERREREQAQAQALHQHQQQQHQQQQAQQAAQQHRGMPPQQHDPRQPSPRLTERGHPADPRGPPARGPADPREYGRPPPPEGYPPYGYERGGPGGPGGPGGGYHPAYDARRDERRFDEREGPPNGPPLRHPSATRDVGYQQDIRAPSPAASTSSKASTRRKVSDNNDRATPLSANRKPPPRKPEPLKKERRQNGDNTPAGSPGPSPAASVSSSAARQPPAPPSRTVDEDYDEGAADALMFLSSDRRASVSAASVSAASAGAERSPPSVLGIKRTTPPSPGSARPGTGNKKVRGSPGPPPSAQSPTRRTVIEVLNAPRIDSGSRPEPPARSPFDRDQPKAPLSSSSDKTVASKSPEKPASTTAPRSASPVAPKSPVKQSSDAKGASGASGSLAPRTPVESSGSKPGSDAGSAAKRDPTPEPANSNEDVEMADSEKEREADKE